MQRSAEQSRAEQSNTYECDRELRALHLVSAVARCVLARSKQPYTSPAFCTLKVVKPATNGCLVTGSSLIGCFTLLLLLLAALPLLAEKLSSSAGVRPSAESSFSVAFSKSRIVSL